MTDNTNDLLLPELREALADVSSVSRWKKRLGLVLAIAALGGIGAVVRVKTRPAPPPRYVLAKTKVEDVLETTQASGAIQPVLQVNIGAQVNGRVVKVLVDFNSRVKKGDVLAEIDPTQYGFQVNQSQANLSANMAQISSAKANLLAVQAQYERTKKMAEERLASQADLDTARGQFEVARASLAAAEAQMNASGAQLQQAMTNKGFTKILSPVDGVVISRAIDPGATVQASFTSPVLFVIAESLTRMRVLADIDEADIGKLKEGMTAEARVDAFPGEVFTGRVEQMRLNPTTTAGVVTYAAVVDVTNPDDKLRPGMTASVTIKVREAKNAVSVPNAALRFKPLAVDGEEPRVYEPLPVGKGRVFLPGPTPQAPAEPLIIDIGPNSGTRTAVLRGLEVGREVVIDETESKDTPAGKPGPSTGRKRSM